MWLSRERKREPSGEWAGGRWDGRNIGKKLSTLYA